MSHPIRSAAALVLAALCLCTGLGLALPATAQTLRWASQGDPQTMDPHSQNDALTNMMNGQVYEGLVSRGKNLELVPALATEWQQVSPLVWRFKLRPGVKFHDGAPFTAADVVFSIERAKHPSSNIAVYGNAVGTPVAIDPLTVEFRLAKVNPVFLQHIAAPLWIMNKAWADKYKATRPLDFKNNEESYAGFHQNGTGPFMLDQRQLGVRTTYKRNPQWWGRFEGNVQAIVYTPIANDATRLAALVSGELDFVLDPAPRDIPRLRRTPGVKIIDGAENRVIFIGMDQYRDELQYSNVKGRNPFKDLRVRQALYHAVDIQAIKTRLMNDQSVPTGGITPSPLGSYNDPAVETRLPFDLAKARQLMAAAGYPNGFEVTLDCPNNRYINDQNICIALAGMWAQLKVKVRVNAMPRASYFPKLEKFDTSMYMLGWGGAVTDAETTITPVLRAYAEGGIGLNNYGRVVNPKFEQLAAASSVEPDPAKREQLVRAALREYTAQVHLIPLHRQVIPWAVRPNVDVVHRADNWLQVSWVRIR